MNHLFKIKVMKNIKIEITCSGEDEGNYLASQIAGMFNYNKPLIIFEATTTLTSVPEGQNLIIIKDNKPKEYSTYTTD